MGLSQAFVIMRRLFQQNRSIVLRPLLEFWQFDLAARGALSYLKICRPRCGLGKATAGEKANRGYCRADLDEDADKHGGSLPGGEFRRPSASSTIGHLHGWAARQKVPDFFVIYPEPGGRCFVQQTQF